ncbi:MAG: phenylalanine--tRNA ligase subunit alpha, partial [Bifidobacteriaceae bacterium]|nr:phenylalanine--tRNA ligase subunit alpha [Bifidobacteriaceae bacterium]
MPEQVSPLDQSALDNVAEHAIAAIAAATSLEELAQVRRETTGEASQIAAANRAIKDLPGPDKAQAGKNMGAVKQLVFAALADRQKHL